MKPEDDLRALCARIVADLAPFRGLSDRLNPAPFRGLSDRLNLNLDFAPLRELSVRLNLDFAPLPKLHILGLDAVEESLKRQRAARARPDDPRSKPWLATGWMTPREREPIERYLPDPTKRPPRQAIGSGQVAAIKEELFAEMDQLLAADSKLSLTAAARQVRQARQLLSTKDSASYLVRLYKAHNSAKYSDPI